MESYLLIAWVPDTETSPSKNAKEDTGGTNNTEGVTVWCVVQWVGDLRPHP